MFPHKEKENMQRVIMTVKGDNICKGPSLMPSTRHLEYMKISVGPHPCQLGMIQLSVFTSLIGPLKVMILFQRQSLSSQVQPEKQSQEEMYIKRFNAELAYPTMEDRWDRASGKAG